MLLIFIVDLKSNIRVNEQLKHMSVVNKGRGSDW